jgi:ABC-type transporter Mla subunit MlaD
MPYTLIFDIVFAVLLVVTIGYAATLNKRLNRLRKDKKDLENLARTFGESTQRAEENLNQLRTVAQALDIQMQRAQTLRDDIAFLADRGGSTADRLEELVREARDGLGVVPKPASASIATAQPRKAPEVEPRGMAAKAPNDAEKGGIEPRSDAERELLRALRDAG